MDENIHTADMNKRKVVRKVGKFGGHVEKWVNSEWLNLNYKNILNLYANSHQKSCLLLATSKLLKENKVILRYNKIESNDEFVALVSLITEESQKSTIYNVFHMNSFYYEEKDHDVFDVFIEYQLGDKSLAEMMKTKKKFSFQDRVKMINDICQALFAYEEGQSTPGHHIINSHNVFYVDGVYKLQKVISTRCVSDLVAHFKQMKIVEGFVAPELIKENYFLDGIDYYKAEVYSLGILWLEILCYLQGTPRLFDDFLRLSSCARNPKLFEANRKLLLKSIKKVYPKEIPFIKKMTRYSSSSRPTIQKITMKCSRWVKANDKRLRSLFQREYNSLKKQSEFDASRIEPSVKMDNFRLAQARFYLENPPGKGGLMIKGKNFAHSDILTQASVYCNKNLGGNPTIQNNISLLKERETNSIDIWKTFSSSVLVIELENGMSFGLFFMNYIENISSNEILLILEENIFTFDSKFLGYASSFFNFSFQKSGSNSLSMSMDVLLYSSGEQISPLFKTRYKSEPSKGGYSNYNDKRVVKLNGKRQICSIEMLQKLLIDLPLQPYFTLSNIKAVTPKHRCLFFVPLIMIPICFWALVAAVTESSCHKIKSYRRRKKRGRWFLEWVLTFIKVFLLAPLFFLCGLLYEMISILFRIVFFLSLIFLMVFWVYETLQKRRKMGRKYGRKQYLDVEESSNTADMTPKASKSNRLSVKDRIHKIEKDLNHNCGIVTMSKDCITIRNLPLINISEDKHIKNANLRIFSRTLQSWKEHIEDNEPSVKHLIVYELSPCVHVLEISNIEE